MSEYLGLGDRLTSGPSTELAQIAFAHELGATSYLWTGMSHADIAHTIALAQAGVVTPDVASELMTALLSLDRLDFSDVELDPAIGDLYNNRNLLLERLAPGVSGHLHAGRARREASTIGWLLSCRMLLLDLIGEVASLTSTLADLSEHHSTTLMPDFTYLHRAHPTSLGHYLQAHAWPVARHLDRAQGVLALLNASSPAGSGSVNGTSIPLDRHLLASLLGFDDVMWHTRDSMWAPDLVLDLVGVTQQVMTTVDRLAEELQLWTTEAFGFVELSDEHSRTSVVMPHKKNPYALTHLRGSARRLLGTAVGVNASMLTASGQPDNRTIAYHDVPSMLEVTADSTRLLTAVLGSATFDERRLADAAADPFMASTDICDFLTLRRGIDNRTAHQIVGLVVRASIEAGERAVTTEALIRSASGHGIDLVLDPIELEAILDARSIVDSRRTHGGAGPDSVTHMAGELRSRSAAASASAASHPASTYRTDLDAVARNLVQQHTDEGKAT